ncbi:MAG: SDR family oxidoreductase [Nanoarchaeota archaeon]|nr:SDR family oxidoreductase [Nanoarchaeota archaeon]MBU4452417.1 SDR family oxidoreductase [Nanoarchaeota archaeon]MCG2723891.1 SDR family oxidoreductase [archaeon]
MKLLIFGATGKCGQHIIRQALKHKYEVTAFARNPKAITLRHERLKIAAGNVFSLPSIESAVKGHQVVICALGTNSKYPTRMLSEGTANIIKAMEKCRVKRLVCLTSLGALGTDGSHTLRKIMIPLFYRHVFTDKKRQLEEIMNSGLDWIVVRAVKMTNGPRTKHYHAALVRPIKNSVSRANVAAFVLKQVAHDKFLREMPIVSD